MLGVHGQDASTGGKYNIPDCEEALTVAMSFSLLTFVIASMSSDNVSDSCAFSITSV